MIRPSQYDTSLAEFTYTVARNIPISLKRFLPERLYRAISTEKGAQRFSSRSTEEQKREFFAYLGIESFLIFADMKKGQVCDIRDIFSVFDSKEKPEITLKKLGEKNVFVSSSKELVYRLGHMAQLMDTSAYTRSLELARTNFHVSNFKNKLTTPEHKAPVEEKEDAVDFVKILGATLWTNNICIESTGIDSPTMQMLIQFYIKKHTYVSRDFILKHFAGSLSVRQVTVSEQKMLQGLLIQKNPVAATKSFTITAKGILVVNQFRDKVIKSLDF